MGISLGIPSRGLQFLLAGLFGILRAKPKEIWSYGFLHGRLKRYLGLLGRFAGRWFRRLGLVLVLSSLLAAVVGVLASYGGLALRKVVNRIRADPEEPPSILRT